MKKYLLIIIFQWMVVESFSQAGVGIGVIAPHASAALHVQPPTNNKGLLIPRLTTAQRNAINPPLDAEGLMVFDTDVHALFYFYNNVWQQVGMPAGTIVMWSGLVPPAGWALCDGSPGTPDLRERFIVGAGAADNLSVTGAPYPIGVGGDLGRNSVTLTTAQMPSHTHTIQPNGLHNHNYDAPLTSGNHPGGNSGFDRPNSLEQGTTTDNGTHTHTMTSAGGDQAHENRPPYYALAFIIKL